MVLEQRQEAAGKLGVIIYGHTRPTLLRNNLESLRRQGMTANVHVWLDGHASRATLKELAQQCKELVKREFPWAVLTTANGNVGIEKLMIDGLSYMSEHYDKIIVLEDDCFPTASAIAEFDKALNQIKDRQDVYSVYGHHFLTASEGETITRFQGWGWAILPEIRKCFAMVESDYLAWVRKNLTPEVVKRLDVTPGRNCVPVIASHFCWDGCTCLLTAIRGLSHKKTAKRVIYNCGLGDDSMHFKANDRYLQPPFNMIHPKNAWDYYDDSSKRATTENIQQQAAPSQPVTIADEKRSLQPMEIVVDGITFRGVKRTKSQNNSVGFSDDYFIKIEHEKHPRKLRALAEEIEIIRYLNSNGCVSCPKLISEGRLEGGERYFIQQRIHGERQFNTADMIFSILEQKSLGVSEGDFRKDNFIFGSNGVCYIIDYDQAIHDERFKNLGNVEYLEWFARYMEQRWKDYGVDDFYKWGGYNKDEIFSLFRNGSFNLASTTIFREQLTTNTKSGVYHNLSTDRIYIEGCRDLNPRLDALNSIEFKKGEKILDVGCNMGLLSHYLHDRGCRVAGIDMDPKIVVGAKMVANILGKDISFERLDLDEEEIAEDYDTVCLFSVIHHVKNFTGATENIAQRCSRIILECALKEYGSKPVGGKWADTSGWEFNTVEELTTYLEGVFKGFKLSKYHGSVDRNRHIISIAKERTPAPILREYPRITLVTPSFNQAPYLEKCLCSVLEQDYPNIEYIVVDGGSTDGSADIIKKYSSQFHWWASEPDQGQYHAIMKGFARSSGTIMGWLNSDDMLHPGALATVADIMSHGSPVEWLMGAPTIRDARGRTVIVKPPIPWTRARYFSGNYKWIQQESTFWSRSLWERAGGTLDTRYSFAADMELWFRFFRHARFFTANVLLGAFRYHGDQKTGHSMEKYLREAEEILATEVDQFLKGGDSFLPPAQSVINFDMRQDRFIINENVPAPSSPDQLVAELSRRGQELAKAGNLYEALQQFIAVVPHRPRAADLFTIIGNLYQATGHVPAALAAFLRALELDPKNAAALAASKSLAPKSLDKAEKKEHTELVRTDTAARSRSSVGAAVTTKIVPVENFDHFTFSKKSHVAAFRKNEKIGIESDLKAYQDLLVLNFILDNVPPGSRLLEIGGDESRIIAELEHTYECWNIDKLEGLGSGPLAVKTRGYKLVRDYMGCFNRELPDDYFDLIFSISALEHVPEDETTFRNICLDIDRVLKPGGYSLHCFNVILKKDSAWTNQFVPFLFGFHLTSNRFVPLSNLYDDPDLWAMSEAAYSRHWADITKISYDEHGKPASYNVLWQKQHDAADPKQCPALPQNCSRTNPRGKKDEVLISAIVSTYNSEKYIRGCLEDLESQTIADRIEIIVVDSGSKENEAAIVKEFQQRYNNIKYIRTERETIYGAWNRGIKAASGKYLTNANTDDRHYKDSLEKLAAALEQNPRKVIAYGNMHVTSILDGDIIGEKRAGELNHLKLLNGMCIDSQPMWRRDLHDIIGYFDEQFFCSGDYEFWIRATQQFEMIYLDIFIGKRLINDTVVSLANKSLQALENRIISQSYEYALQMDCQIGKEGISRDSRFANWPEIGIWNRQVAAKLSSKPWQPDDELVAVKDSRTASCAAKLSIIAVETDATEWPCVLSLAAQDDQDFELILITYRELPSTVDLRTFNGRLCVIQLKNDIGIAFARNVGAAYAKGDLVAYLHPGMQLEQGWVQAAFRRFMHPGVKAARGQTIGKNDPSQVAITESYATFLDSVDNCAIRKAALLEVEGFDEDLLTLEGHEFSYRMYKGAKNALDVIRFEPGMLAHLDTDLSESQCIMQEIRNAQMQKFLWRKYNDIEGYREFYRSQDPATRGQYEYDYDRTIASAIFFENDHPDLALNYAHKAHAIEPDEQIKGSYLFGSMLLKYGKYEQARDVLESAAVRLVSIVSLDPDRLVSARQRESYENNLMCYVSTSTKLAHCCLHLREYGKIKTLYQLLLAHRNLPIEPQQAAAFEAVLAKLSGVAAVPLTLRPRQLQVGSEQVHASQIPALPVNAEEQPQSKCLISAIVSTYNSEEFLRGCIEDLERQTIADKLEIIVVNSGSQQNEEDIVKEFQSRYENIRYIKTEREGLYAAWNRAIKVATGKYLTSANTDDRHRKDCCEKLVIALEADPGLVLAYADQVKSYVTNETFDNTSATLTYTYPEFSPEVFLQIGHHHIGSQPMWRKDLHDTIGLFDDKFQVAGDYDFLLKICEHFRCVHIPEVLGTFHHSPHTISGSQLDLLNKIENPLARARSFYRQAIKAIERNDHGMAIELLQRSINDWPSREALQRVKDYGLGARPAQDSFDIASIRSIYDWPDTVAFLQSGVDTVHPDTSVADTFANLLTQKMHAYAQLCSPHRQPTLMGTDVCESNLLKQIQNDDANVVRKVCDFRPAGHQAQLSIIIVATGELAEQTRILAALSGQTVTDFEVIVVDAGSPVEEHTSGPSASDLQLCYIELNADCGPALARNVGAAHATSGIVTFLDHGLLPQADFVKNLLAHFTDHALAGLRGRVLSHNGIHNNLGNFDCGDQPCIAVADIEGLCAFRRDIFFGVHGFDHRLCFHHGPELSCRVFNHCASNPACIKYFPDVVAFIDTCPSPAEVLKVAIDVPLYMALADRINPQLTQYREFVIGSYPQNRLRYEMGFLQLLSRAAFLENWDLSQALTLAQKACVQQPDSFKAEYVLGSIYTKLGDFKNASVALEQVIDPLLKVIASTAHATTPEEVEDHRTNIECMASIAAKLAQCYLKLGTMGKFKTMCQVMTQDAFVPDSVKDSLNSILGKLHNISPEPIIPVQKTVLAPQSACDPSTTQIVSIIMPVYNCRQYIGQAIKSVLAQSYPKFELVIVDDGSTDDSVDIIRSFTDRRIEYIRQENGGASSARNAGIQRSRGQFLVMLDSDDVIISEYLREHLRSFHQHPDADLVYCDHALIDEHGHQIREMKQFEYADRPSLVRDMFRCGYPVIQPRGMLRRSVFDAIGLFDESLLVGEDYDLMVRFVKAGLTAVRLPLPQYGRRIRPRSLSNDDNPAKTTSHFTVIDRFIASFDHTELFPDVNWSVVPSDKVAATAKCLVGATLFAMAKNYHASKKPTSVIQALTRATANLRQSASAGFENAKSRQLLRDCEIFRRQVLLQTDGEAIQELNTCDDNYTDGSLE
jgi:glycosyltransferase involved in cell wall biosynthesis